MDMRVLEIIIHRYAGVGEVKPLSQTYDLYSNPMRKPLPGKRIFLLTVYSSELVPLRFKVIIFMYGKFIIGILVSIYRL